MLHKSDLQQRQIDLPELSIVSQAIIFENALVNADDIRLLTTKKQLQELEFCRKKQVCIGEPVDLTYSGWSQSLEYYSKLETALCKIKADYFELDTIPKENVLVIIPLTIAKADESHFYVDWQDKWMYVSDKKIIGKTKKSK